MIYLRAAVLLEAVLLYAVGMMCLAYPSALNALGLFVGTSDISARCAFSLALMCLAVLLLQMTTDLARFRPLVIMSLLLTAISSIGLGIVYSLRGFGNPAQMLAAFFAALTLITFFGISRMLAKREEPQDVPSLPSIPPDSTSSAISLHQARMKYAWDWFQFHADQRLKAFNFFLVLLGILIVAYGAAMKESLTNAATATSSSVPTNSVTTKTSTTSTTGTASKQSSVSTGPTTSKTDETSVTSTTLPNPRADAVAKAYSTFAAVVALCGFIVSFAFYMIEIRNVELVECGRRWLDALEGRLGMTIRQDDRDRTCLPRAVDWLTALFLMAKPSVKHQFWMRVLYVMAAFGFARAAMYALYEFNIM